MEWFAEYSSELWIGGGGTIVTILSTIIKAMARKVSKIEARLTDLERKLDINTALDKERAK